MEYFTLHGQIGNVNVKPVKNTLVSARTTMLVLRMGDPHIKPNNLKESEALLQFTLDKAVELRINVLEIEGDIFDTHSLVHLSVIEFWDKWFNILSKQTFLTRVLVGNHDLTGNYSSSYSALHPFLKLENPYFKIIHEPYIHLNGKIGYLPYIHDNDKFVQEANKLADQGATVLVSHTDYKGAVYDNGSPINNGVNPDLLDPRFIHLISGHIHTELELDRIWYTGTARWLNKSCANKNKGIWLVTHNNETGRIESKEFISTESVCTPIVSLTWNEGKDKPEIPKNAKTYIELVGSSDWVSKTKKDLVGSVSVSSKITDIKKSKERKSGSSLYEFLSNHYGSSPEKSKKIIKYLESLNCLNS